MDLVSVALPHGFSDRSGLWVRRANLRELNGHDEQSLNSIEDNTPTFILISKLLEKVVSFEDDKCLRAYNSAEVLRQMTIGDRVALILHIRKLTFGDNLPCVVDCPSCNKAMSIDLSISSLLRPLNIKPQTDYTVSIDNYRITLRPVNGHDQELLFHNASPTGDGCSTSDKIARLIKTCVLRSDPPLPYKIQDHLIKKISSKLAELDDQAEIVLDLVCPSCKHSFSMPFDIENFFFQEINTRKQQLLQEIHWIAFHYHWSEREILSLPIRKRRQYVELIDNMLSGAIT